jgi:hypothetical protein
MRHLLAVLLTFAPESNADSALDWIGLEGVEHGEYAAKGHVSVE